MDVFPAPDGAVMMMILLAMGICKEKEKSRKRWQKKMVCLQKQTHHEYCFT
jgi:hypothetical protein